MELTATPSFRLDGRRALVTGAGRGIGLAAASALADAGAHVTLASRTTREIEDAAEAIRARGQQAEALTLDVRDVDAVRAAVAGLETPCSSMWAVERPGGGSGRRLAPAAIGPRPSLWGALRLLLPRHAEGVAQGVAVDRGEILHLGAALPPREVVARGLADGVGGGKARGGGGGGADGLAVHGHQLDELADAERRGGAHERAGAEGGEKLGVAASVPATS